MAIAEAMGGYRPDGFGQPPDFLNDLNAMHEAEKVLGDKLIEYYHELAGVICFLKTDPLAPAKITHATASQKAEAFLKTLGKWTDSPQ